MTKTWLVGTMRVSETEEESILLGTIIASIIFCCLCVALGFVVYRYCGHKRKQKETEIKAKLALQESQDELPNKDYHPFFPNKGRGTQMKDERTPLIIVRK